MAAEATRAACAPGDAPGAVVAKAAPVTASAATAVPATTTIARRPARYMWYFMATVLMLGGSWLSATLYAR
jgi:hypothetical protein